ncbi:hypothetical protein HG536_0E04970 [Torulaspora globosa]|uniref:DUF3533 domain-containing protein n=1 Tax=Torulaspora globosa TaxID=48254 RepID=A0A7G3ZJA0_9SACH|nr:uncharacterized protein HG536_0E04970 [Torulaspora globosa]QLL33586.1 hypothetical protein HG536_0E04970 [Torulaspora globosa]
MVDEDEMALNQVYTEGASECMNRVVNKDLHVEGSSEASTAESAAGYDGEAAPVETKQQEEAKQQEGSAALQRMGTRFFSPKMKSHRKKIIWTFVLTNALLAVFVLSLLSIYWGATYNRQHYMFKVNVLTVIQDESELVGTTMSAAIATLVAGVPCTWHVFNASEFSEKYKVSSEEIDDKVVDLIFGEKYWMALNVKRNATNALYDSLTGGPTAFNSTEYFEAIYESGRDPTSLQSAILPNMKTLEGIYRTYFLDQYLPSLLGNLTETPPPDRIIAASNMNFEYVDYRPFYNALLLAPLQVGLIYCLLLTFFQLSLFAPLHVEMSKLLKPRHIILYRIGISWLTYFFLSLFFCTVSAIFQVDFTKAFGRAGFVVYWMSTWLLMMALGGANENVISLVLTLGPQYLGFWLMTWIILNIAPSFYPLVLNNQFYRYGYAMPIHNGVDIYKVIFLNLSKQHMGRNYGILVAWVALNTALLPFVLRYVGKTMRKRAAAAAAAQQTN